jgi:hypothetical protein
VVAVDPTRRRLLGGLAVVALAVAVPRARAAGRPTLTVYKSPT